MLENVERKEMRSIGLKILTIAAVAVLMFSIFTIFLNENEGESKALLSVDDENELRIVRDGNVVLHNISVTNDLGPRAILVNLSAQIVSVSLGGNASNWSVRFVYADVEITQILVDEGDTEIVGVEVYAPGNAILHQTATIRVTGKDGFPPISGPLNDTRCYQNNEYGTYLELKTRVGQSFEVEVGIAPGTEERQDVNPNTPTQFKVRIFNAGLKLDSFTMSFNVGNPETRGARAGDTWKVVFSPSAYIKDLDPMKYTYVYVNVTSPTNAFYGDYPIEVTAASQRSNNEDSDEIIAVIPIPDLYANADDVEFSRFPVINEQEMGINLTIRNRGGALEQSFVVNFWIEDTDREGAFNIIGSITVAAIKSWETGYATVTFKVELSEKITDTLTNLEVKIEIDADSEIIESNEDNNVVNGQIEVMKTPKSSSGYSASAIMVISIVAMAGILTAGVEWNRRKKKNE